MIVRADGRGAVGAVNANAPLAFSHRPLERVQEKTGDEEDEEFRKKNMKRFFFFGGEFRFHCLAIIIDLGMIVVLHSSLQFGGVTHECACEGHAFRRDTLCSREIRRR